MALLTPARVAAQAEMLANRVSKRLRHLRPRMERDAVGAFRLYDRDIPEVRAVVDWFEGHLVVGEYARTQTDLVDDWLGAMARAVGPALGVPPDQIHLRGRGARPRDGARVVVREGVLRLYASVDDPTDVGLFTHHRLLRRRVLAESAGRRVLSLFGHSGTFACAAAKGGAAETLAVDASARHLEAAQDNLSLNDVAGPVHALLRDDVVEFALRAARDARRWDLVVLDPPPLSIRGASEADLRRDHAVLVEAALALVAEGGALWFWTSHARFTAPLDGLRARTVREVTAEMVPEDHRDRGGHRCWRIER